MTEKQSGPISVETLAKIRENHTRDENILHRSGFIPGNEFIHGERAALIQHIDHLTAQIARKDEALEGERGRCGCDERDKPHKDLDP